MSLSVDLADAMDALAEQVATAPVVMIGQQINMRPSEGSQGLHIGQMVNMRAPGIGVSITMSADSAPDHRALADEVRELAAIVRGGAKPKGLVDGLLARLKALGNPVMENAIGIAMTAAAAYFGIPS